MNATGQASKHSRLASAATVDVWNSRRAAPPFRAATRTRARRPSMSVMIWFIRVRQAGRAGVKGRGGKNDATTTNDDDGAPGVPDDSFVKSPRLAVACWISDGPTD